MCAIGGIVKARGEVREEALRALVRVQAHRGPDDEGIYMERGVGLGHRRLSILDLSKASHEPFVSRDGRYHLTFNGEIYNYLELKAELGGTFLTTGDTEVLLRAYEKWGKECVKRFNGIFGFAIWDSKEKELFCARDHLGVKPFYYMKEGDIFYFASEIKGILAARGGKPETNDPLLYEYLAYGMYEHSEETFFKGVLKLPQGHTLLWKDGKITISRFWNLPDSLVDTAGWSDERVQEEFRALLRSSLSLQLRSDVPVGMHASGGIDSSIMAQTAHDMLGGQKNLRMFSFAYAGSSYDEIPYVEELAKTLGWSVDVTHLSPEDVVRLAPSSAWHQDEPHSGLPSLALQRLVESYKDTDIKVILEGQGGDEVSAGYEYYMGAFILDVLRLKGEEEAEQEMEAFSRYKTFKSREERDTFFANAKNAYYTPGGSADGSTFAKGGVLRESFKKTAYAAPRTFDSPFDTALANMQYRDIFHTKLPRVLRSCDRASMAYGRELRVPLIDHRIVSFAMSLPLEQRIRAGEQRFFVREALKGRLPEHIVKTPKRAVVNPQREWFKKELRPWILDILSSKSFGERHLFDQRAVLEEYDAYCKAEKNPNSFHIWQWVNLELWFRAFFD